MANSGDQLRLQSLSSNKVKTWKPKETVILPDDFLKEEKSSLKTTETLSFLKEEKKKENIFENTSWDLNDKKGKIPPDEAARESESSGGFIWACGCRLESECRL